jgi:hypothetical protein
MDTPNSTHKELWDTRFFNGISRGAGSDTPNSTL